MPYHRVETIVEAKPILKEGGPQCATYLYRVQQARPDRPGIYGLYAKPGFFQILYSSPVGVRASTRSDWTKKPDLGESGLEQPECQLDLGLLCAYVYSLYDPPDHLFLYDRTITWSEASNHLFGPPTWNIKAGGHLYSGAMIAFIGYAWGRRTTVFRVARDGLPPVVIKEYYLDSERRYEESDLLAQIHAPGFAHGVVRVVSAEDVQLGDERTIIFQEPGSQATKFKRRLVLADTGLDLEQARSVNDLLKTFYDVLEVHRTIARERRVLHRDMSIFNILMYPEHAQCTGAPWQDFPALIDDVLGEHAPEANAERTPRCLLIDFDHSARLADDEVASQQVLRHRTGTPVYIARAVAARSVPEASYATSSTAFINATMPLLSDEAKRLYVQMYGEDRYNRYNDVEPTCHGGTPPANARILRGRPRVPVQFYHRWEYDAESVFWTMYSVLLRVLPEGIKDEDEATHTALVEHWAKLNDHTIPGDASSMKSDSRVELLDRYDDQFIAPFLPVMHDVGYLLFDIALQVTPSYALMNPLPPYEDHLHEAMQRLILEYLVAHRDRDIPLKPGVLRTAGCDVEEGGREHGMFGSGLKKSTAQSDSKKGTAQSVPKESTMPSDSRGTGSKRPLEDKHKPRMTKKRRIQTERVSQPELPDDRRPREWDPPVLRGEWTWPAERTAEQPPSVAGAGDESAT
ncbi:hypothetical protein C8Q77DRAFT_1056439 [Trametes polyzona]|nr:hypothetical protein C8Q77DRAFT_1056439 [Trametes polyzona]